MKKEVVFAKDAPKPAGTYNHGITLGNLVFTAGQIALNPETNEVVKGTAEEEADQVMRNLGAILKASGTDFDHLLKATIYVTDLADFQAVDSVYKKYVTNEVPGRTCIQVVAVPGGGRFEMEMIAYRENF